MPQQQQGMLRHHQTVLLIQRRRLATAVSSRKYKKRGLLRRTGTILRLDEKKTSKNPRRVKGVLRKKKKYCLRTGMIRYIQY